MAKRYHQTKSDRHHESLGMHDYYSGMNARRRMEMEDAGMIHEDHRAVANMPQEVKMMPYGKAGSYMPEGLDDTIRGVDRQISLDDGKRREHLVPKKV